MKTMSRRTFLALAILGLAVVAVPWAWFKHRRGDATDLVVAILKRRVGYLKTPPGSFEEFAKAYVEEKKDHRQTLRSLSVLALPLTYFTVYPMLPMGHGLRRLENTVVSIYLLSTDFFQHGADETRELHYVAYFNPERVACRHPFARRALDV